MDPTQVNDVVFVSLMSLYMSADPSPVGAYDNEVISDFLNAEARVRGFTDWVHAWNSIQPLR